jgi:hypothetical protein
MQTMSKTKPQVQKLFNKPYNGSKETINKGGVNEPKPMDGTTIQNGPGAVKACFSISGARVDNKNILYLGVHGDITKVSLSDHDANLLMDVLEALLNDVSS